MNAAQGSVWVFHGEGAHFAGAVFTSRARAEAWIEANRLTGILTEYPVDIPVYEWAIERGYFTPKRHDHRTPSFIGGFTTAGQDHHHYVDGTDGSDIDPDSDS